MLCGGNFCKSCQCLDTADIFANVGSAKLRPKLQGLVRAGLYFTLLYTIDLILFFANLSVEFPAALSPCTVHTSFVCLRALCCKARDFYLCINLACLSVCPPKRSKRLNRFCLIYCDKSAI